MHKPGATADVVILACNMPGLSGLLVLREMRKLIVLYDTPVLILTDRRSDPGVELAHF